MPHVPAPKPPPPGVDPERWSIYLQLAADISMADQGDLDATDLLDKSLSEEEFTDLLDTLYRQLMMDRID